MDAAISTTANRDNTMQRAAFFTLPKISHGTIVDDVELVNQALNLLSEQEGLTQPSEDVRFSPYDLDYNCLNEAMEYAVRNNIKSVDAVMQSEPNDACIEAFLTEITEHISQQLRKDLPDIQTALTESFINGLTDIYPLMDEQRMRDWIKQCLPCHSDSFELLFCNARIEGNQGHHTNQSVFTISTTEPCMFNLFLPRILQNSKLVDAAHTISHRALHSTFKDLSEYTFCLEIFIEELDLSICKTEKDVLKQRKQIIEAMSNCGMVDNFTTPDQIIEMFEDDMLEKIMLIIESDEKRTKGKKLHDLLLSLSTNKHQPVTHIHTMPLRTVFTSVDQYNAVVYEMEGMFEEQENTYMVSPLKALDSLKEVATNMTLLSMIDAFGCYNTPLHEFSVNSTQELTDDSYNTIPLTPL